MKGWTPVLVSVTLGACAGVSSVGEATYSEAQEPWLENAERHTSRSDRRAVAHRALAVAYLNAGRPEVALREARLALEAAPRDPFALHTAALSCAMLGLTDAAFDFFEALYGRDAIRTPAAAAEFAATEGVAAAHNFAAFLCDAGDDPRVTNDVELLDQRLQGVAPRGAREAARRALGTCGRAPIGSRSRPRSRQAMSSRRRIGPQGRISTHCRLPQRRKTRNNDD